MRDMDDKVALFDMDGTVADYEGQLRKNLEWIRGEAEEPLPDDIWDRDSECQSIARRIQLFKQLPGWWKNLPKLQLGFDVLDVAKRVGFEVHFLTNGPKSLPHAWQEKVQWIDANVPDADGITITRAKKLIYGRVLVDDFPKYMLEWLGHRPRGLGIMPAGTSNRDFSHPQVVRYDGTNLAEVEDRMFEAFNRRGGE